MEKPGTAANNVITASEVACWVYCPEQWRLEYGQGLKPANRKELAAGGSITLGRFLAAVGAVVLLLLLWRWL